MSMRLKVLDHMKPRPTIANLQIAKIDSSTVITPPLTKLVGHSPHRRRPCETLYPYLPPQLGIYILQLKTALQPCEEYVEVLPTIPAKVGWSEMAPTLPYPPAGIVCITAYSAGLPGPNVSVCDPLKGTEY